MRRFILPHRLSRVAHRGFLIKSRVGSLLLCAAKEVTPLAAAHLLKFRGWVQPGVVPSELSHGQPKPPHKSKKEAGSRSNAAITKS